MTITLCKACGTSYEFSENPPQHCPICEDERQFVPVGGQQWIALNKLTASHSNKWQQHNSALFSIRTIPDFAINQRAFLLRTPQGNILWDCIANLDEATKTLVSALGGLKAIAISHPHYYSCMQDWAAEFKAPIYLHGDDRQWVMRDSPWITFWEGDSLQLTADASLIRLGAFCWWLRPALGAGRRPAIIRRYCPGGARSKRRFFHVELSQYATAAGINGHGYHSSAGWREIQPNLRCVRGAGDSE